MTSIFIRLKSRDHRAPLSKPTPHTKTWQNTLIRMSYYLLENINVFTFTPPRVQFEPKKVQKIMENSGSILANFLSYFFDQLWWFFKLALKKITRYYKNFIMDYIVKPVKFLFPPALNCIILAFTNDPEKVKNVMESFWPPHTK